MVDFLVKFFLHFLVEKCGESNVQALMGFDALL